MERTRIVHYTHSRTPVILSPTISRKPRLSSSSSLSSLVSGKGDNAPLASCETENPTTPRRASKSGDQHSIRSSSTGRLLHDEYKIHTSIYTALRCQDYPVPPSAPTTRRVRNECSTKERPRSEFIPHNLVNGKSFKTDDDAANYRHTLGSWSRSRRPSHNDSPNASLQRNHTMTLPIRRTGKIDSTSSTTDTLVKSRRRYTWLSSKHTPQSPTTTRSPSEQGADDDDSFSESPTSPDVSSRSPNINVRPDSGVYNWKSDPRRKPCQFVDGFDLSSPQTPTEHGFQDYTCQEYVKTSVSSDVGYSSTTTENNQSVTTLPQQSPTAATNQRVFDLEKCNTSPHQFKKQTSFVVDTNSSGDRGRNTIRTPEENQSPKNSRVLYSHDQNLGITVSLVRGDSTETGPNEDDSKHNIRLNGTNSPHNINRKNRSSPKSKSFSTFSGGTAKSQTAEDTLKCLSPRSRRSFQLAVGNSWADLMPASNTTPDLPDRFSPVPESGDFSEKEDDGTRRRQSSKQDDIFVSCNDLVSPEPVNGDHESNHRLSKYMNHESPSTCRLSVDGVTGTVNQNENESSGDDSLTRRLKRNSMRLATSSLSDITCAIDEIDISDIDTDKEHSEVPDPIPVPKELNETKSSHNISMSPIVTRSNLSRTGSLLSSQNSSSFGSFYSCQSMDGISYKNSPSPNTSHRAELRARFDSPSNGRFIKNYSTISGFDSSPWDGTFPRASSTRTSSPVSSTSSGRSSHRQRPAYYWTRQTPYPRLLYTASNSVASSKGSMDHHRASSPQPSITSSIRKHGNPLNNSRSRPSSVIVDSAHLGNEHSERTKSFTKYSNRENQDGGASLDNDNASRQQVPSRPIDRRSMTLPISSPHCPPSFHPDRQFDFYHTPYAPDLSPTSVSELESPNSNGVRSPPSLGRPRRKQYAGFDSQPLPMDSFMSDSSSVYTGVSCSSRGTDMTGQPDNGQFDESFMSEDVRSYFEEDVRSYFEEDVRSYFEEDVRSYFEGDSREHISFETPETLKTPTDGDDVHKGVDGSESTYGSVRSTSTTKHGNGDSSIDETSCEDSSLHNISCDEFIENSHDDTLTSKCKQFGSEYDALFRLYKSDEITVNDMFTSPSYPMFLQNGKAFSSSCLLRSELYSKRKFLSNRDIFDLIRNTDKTPLDGTVSLTSLERQAHKVCEAILCCDEMERGYIDKETHSLV